MASAKAPRATPSKDAATLGEPSYVWRSGQERRLDLIRRHQPVEGRWVLDLGCGIGTFVRRFRELTPHAYGVDISTERVLEGSRSVPGLLASTSEQLPFRDGVFDLVLLNEVIEHVRDDRRTLEEALRVTRPGGRVVIYAPNRGYPFETHGIVVSGAYRFGNFPLVNYLPARLRDRLVPHARVYGAAAMRRLCRGLPAVVERHGYVYPGFDNVAARRPALARVVRAILYRAERGPAARFGISHLVVLRRR